MTMNEFEAIEAIYAIRGVTADDAMNFISMVSGYLAVAYFVGDKLSKFQMWAVTGLYSVWVIGPIAGFYTGVIDMARLGGMEAAPMVRYPLWVPVLMGASWVVSVLFMLQVRSRLRGGTRLAGES